MLGRGGRGGQDEEKQEVEEKKQNDGQPKEEDPNEGIPPFKSHELLQFLLNQCSQKFRAD